MPDGSAAAPLRLSIVMEWVNTRLHGTPRAHLVLERIRRQWRDVREGRLPATLPAEAKGLLDRLEPRAQLLLLCASAPGPELGDGLRTGLEEGFDLEIRVAEGLEYYALKSLGGAQADGDLILFVDSDVLPDEGWLAHLLGSFADPQVGVVAGQTYVAPQGVFAAAFSLGWTYDLRDPEAGLIRPAKFYANNLAFRAEVFRQTGFRPVGRRSRGGCSLLREDLGRLGIAVWENRRAGVDHPPPSGWRHMLVRSLAHGRDHALRHAEARSLRGVRRSVGVAARRLVRGAARTLRHGRRVGLAPWQVPPVLAIQTLYYGVFALGGVLTFVHPDAMTRHFRV